MTGPALLYAMAGALLAAIGIHGVVVHEHPLRKILALNILGSGVFLVFVALARGDGAGLPDPVPHAMVLTGIVVAVSATAVALALLVRLPPGPEPGESRPDDSLGR